MKLVKNHGLIIDVLVDMVTKLKSQASGGQIGRNAIIPTSAGNKEKEMENHVADTTDKGTGILVLSMEKAKAFEMFKRGYPSSDWIDAQKELLKSRYIAAKQLGEHANNLRLQTKLMKESMARDETNETNSKKDDLLCLVKEYKHAYAGLKEFKTEIEHLQHLLEAARIRMTRDFEYWYVECANEEPRISGRQVDNVGRFDSKTTLSEEIVDSTTDDISAFYKARNEIMGKKA